MKVTVDTKLKTLTLHGSFKYADFVAFHQAMPEEWVDFEYIVEPITYSAHIPYLWDRALNPPFTVTCTDHAQLHLFGDPVQSNT